MKERFYQITRFIKIVNFWIIIILLFTSIRAQGQPAIQTANDYIGKDVSTLVTAWDQPDIKIKQKNGYETYIYKIPTHRVYRQQGPTPVGINMSGTHPVVVVDSNTNPTNTLQPLELVCTVTFIVDANETVKKVSLRGNGC